MTLLCTASSISWAGTLEGTAYYRERIALPPDAMFEAQLQDLSRADAPAVVDADYKALKAAYLKVRAKPGERLLASLEGLLTQRAAMPDSRRRTCQI